MLESNHSSDRNAALLTCRNFGRPLLHQRDGIGFRLTGDEPHSRGRGHGRIFRDIPGGSRNICEYHSINPPAFGLQPFPNIWACKKVVNSENLSKLPTHDLVNVRASGTVTDEWIRAVICTTFASAQIDKYPLFGISSESRGLFTSRPRRPLSGFSVETERALPRETIERAAPVSCSRSRLARSIRIAHMNTLAIVKA